MVILSTKEVDTDYLPLTATREGFKQMEIRINDTWTIKGDELNFTLTQKKLTNGKGKNAGETRMTEVIEGYYCTPQDAVKGFIRKVPFIPDDFKGDLEGYCNRLENLYDTNFERFSKLIKGVK